MAARQADDDARVAKLVATGTPSVRTIYADGGQNPEFRALALTDVSRPEALIAPTDWVVDPSGAKNASPVVKVAGRKAARAAAKARAGDPAIADRSDRTSSVRKDGTPGQKS